MANRRAFYFAQEVTEAELNAGFDGIETAVFNLSGDLGLSGVDSGLAAAQHSPSPDLSVDVTSGVAYDPLGKRCAVPSLQVVDVSQDFNSTTTVVVTPGNSKILSVFLEFRRALSDLRTDGHNNTISFVQNESFGFRVVQGTEAPSPVAPALDGTRVLLCDITLIFGQSTVVTGDISTSRRQDTFVRAGSPHTIRRGRIKDVVADLTDWINSAATAVTALQAADGTFLVQAATIAALKAVTARPTNAVYSVPGYGIFVYVPASTATSDDRFTVTPTDVGAGAGRWISLGGSLRSSMGGAATPFGLIQGDGAGRVDYTKVRYGIVDTFAQVNNTAWYTTVANTSSTTFVDITGLDAAFSNALVGDVIDVVAVLNAGVANTLHPGQLILRVVEGDASVVNIESTRTNIVKSGALLGDPSLEKDGGTLVASYTVAFAGTVHVKPSYRSLDGAGAIYLVGPQVFKCTRYRP